MELANKLKGERYNAMYKSESYFIFSRVCIYLLLIHVYGQVEFT